MSAIFDQFKKIPQNSSAFFSTTAQQFLRLSTAFYFKTTVQDILSLSKEDTHKANEFMEQQFAKALVAFAGKTTSEILQILKINGLFEAEDIILKELNIFIVDYGKKNTDPNLKKIETILLQLVLNLEKVYLINLMQAKLGFKLSQDASNCQAEENKLMAAKKHAAKLLKKWLQELNFYFQMQKLDLPPLQNDDLLILEDERKDPEEEFDEILKGCIIYPFAEKMNQELQELFTEVDLPTKYLTEVKKLAKSTPRRLQRKPQTPSKIEKEEIKLGSQSRSSSRIREGKKVCDVAIQTEQKGLLGKRMQSQATLMKEEVVRASSYTIQMSQRANKLLCNSLHSQIDDKSLFGDDNEQENSKTSLISTQFNSHNNMQGFSASNASHDFFEKFHNIDTTQLINLSQEINELKKEEPKLESRQTSFAKYETTFTATQNYSQRRSLLRMPSKQYKTKRPKQEKTIIKTSITLLPENSKPSKRQKMNSIALRIQQRANDIAKVKYNRIKSNNGTVENTPQDLGKFKELNNISLKKNLFGADCENLSNEIEMLFSKQ